MQQRLAITRLARSTLLAISMVLGLCALSTPLMANETVDPEVDQILKAMTAYLGAQNTVSVNLDIDQEMIDIDGRKLQFSASTTLVAERPSNLLVHRRGMLADVGIVYDGKLLTVHDKGVNRYVQFETSGTIGDAVDLLSDIVGIGFPAGDLFYPDAYAGLMDGVSSADYMGTAFVNGIACHHLAFRKAAVDWQLWVQTGDAPLPMKYVITSKWVTGAPQYSARFRDWNTKPEIRDHRFAFSPPPGAKKMGKIKVDALGELVLEDAQ